MYELKNEQAISDAKALANTAVRGAIKIAHQIIDGAQNPVYPVVTPALPKESVAKSDADPTGKAGIAGGAHESAVGADPAVGAKDEKLEGTLKDHEERPKVDYKKKRMKRFDGASYHVFMSFVPEEYKGAFKPFDALVLDPNKDEGEQEPDIEIDDLEMKTRADVQFGVGVSLIFLESVLRA
jgi:hypothetical protein